MLHGRWRLCLQGELWSIWEWLSKLCYWSIAALRRHCGAGEDSRASLGQQGEQTRQSLRKSTLNTHGRMMQMQRLQYFGPLMWTADTLEKTWMLGKIEGRRRSGQQRMKWSDGITNSMDFELGQTPRDGKGQGTLVCCSPWGHKESDMT